MELTSEFAEILGMFAADGCLQENYICMWGNIREDRDYYDNIVCPLFSKVFNRVIKAHEKKSNGVYGFYLCDKEIVNLFKSIGFTRKKTYTVRVPEIIINSDDCGIYTSFIRGFADCDGGISFMIRKGKYSEFKLKYNTYPRIMIGVVSPYIVNDISFMLNKLNLKHTTYGYKNKQKNEEKVYYIYLRGTERINDWMRKIGFHNPSQISRYQVWSKFGICPPKTTFEQRKLMLNGSLNPFLFSNANA